MPETPRKAATKRTAKPKPAPVDEPGDDQVAAGPGADAEDVLVVRDEGEPELGDGSTEAEPALTLDEINDIPISEPVPKPPESAEQQIDRLAAFISENVPGEPSASEGAVDVAIRLLSDGGGIDIFSLSLIEWGVRLLEGVDQAAGIDLKTPEGLKTQPSIAAQWAQGRANWLSQANALLYDADVAPVNE